MRYSSAVLAALMLLAIPAVAQQTLPFARQGETIATPQARAVTDSMLTTKDAPKPVALPWAQPVQVAPPGAQALPAAIPFGKSTASQYQPIPEGPHTATAVPVENIDAIEASEPAPAVPTAPEADPANEDPAAPTELTAPIFKTEENAPPRNAVVLVLNKVTARAQKIEIRPGSTEKVGKLAITASHCQLSAPNSLPDAAALLEIQETPPGEKVAKTVFSGWMYQSSPSVSALEHPVYDVMLVECKSLVAEAKPAEKAGKKPAKPKKK